MDCSMPGFPVHYQLPELAQTHVHQVSDAIQSSHPLSSPSPPAFNRSQHQVLFQWVSSSHQVAKVWAFQLQHQSFQWIFRTDFLEDGLVGSRCSPRDSQESSPTPQFKSIILQCSAFFIVQLSHPYMTTGKTIALTRQTFVGRVMLLFNMLSRLVIVSLPKWVIYLKVLKIEFKESDLTLTLGTFIFPSYDIESLFFSINKAI